MRLKLIIICSAMLLLLICYLSMGAAFCAATLHVRRQVGKKPDQAVLASIPSKEGVSLRAWWFPHASRNQNCVIVLYGIGDSRSSSANFAPMFLNRGYSVLAPDSRAHGDSEGRFVTYGLMERYDVISWAHWMRAQGCSRIYGLGESLGASVLIQAIAVEPVFRAVVAECPFADLRQMAEYRMRQRMPIPYSFSRPIAALIAESGLDYALIFYGLDFRQVLPEVSLRHSVTPVLLIHGLKDQRTPPQQSRLLASARPHGTKLWLIPDASHTNASVVAATEFQNRVLAWFALSE